MIRELDIQIHTRKSALSAKLATFTRRKVALQQELHDVDAELISTELKLANADAFSQRVRASQPHCVDCYIETQQLLQMTPMASTIPAVDYYRCRICGNELSIER